MRTSKQAPQRSQQKQWESEKSRRTSVLSAEIWPSSAGSVPYSLLFGMSSCSREDSFPITGGIVPRMCLRTIAGGTRRETGGGASPRG